MSRTKWMSSLISVVAFTALAVAQPDDPTAKNKQLVLAFFQTVFVDHQVADGFAKYVGETYTQHNPSVPDGKDAAIALLSRILVPGSRSELKRAVAERDLVVLHVHSRASETDPGRAVVDIFRVEDGKIVEHWDVIQAVPPNPANTNTMF